MARSNDISPARRAAFEILRRVEDGAFASILLATSHRELKPTDRALTHELVLGVLRRQLFLDSLITHFSNRATATLDLPVRLALRLGLYQLRFLTRIPSSAAVNESVKLVRFARVRSSDAFVNAVLRRATREPDFDPTASIKDPVARLAVETSHPTWLLQKWIKDFGFDFTADLARANNIAPPLSFRVLGNRSKQSEVIAVLKKSDAQVFESEIASGAWRCSISAAPLVKLAQEGLVYIQDEASQLVALLAAEVNGRRVLDLCAAPGSKTSLIASLSQKSKITASDLSEPRLRTVVQTVELHGLSNIQYVVLDGLKSLAFPHDTFDTILVDAPCSGTGTLRRNPEIRWRITAGDIQDLATRQTQLLKNAAAVLKSSGTIVYSTCSIEPEENEAVVSSFLEQHPDFFQVAIQNAGSLKTETNALRTWPHINGCDGFFVTLLRRKPLEN